MSDVSDGEEPTSGKRRRASPGPGRSSPPAKAARVDGSEPESALAPRGENGEPEARAGAAEAEQLPGERASASESEERKGGSAPSPSSAGGGAPVPASSCGGGGAPSSSEAPGAAAAPGGSAHLEEPSDWAAMAAAEALASLTGAGRGGGVQAEAQEGPGGGGGDDDDDDSSSPTLKRQGGGSGVQPGSPTPPGGSAAGPGGEGREEEGDPAADSPGGPSSPPPRCQEDAECAIVSVKVVPETRRSVALLARVQGSLEAIERRAARVYRRMELKFNTLRRPHLEERGNIIQTIPGFWVTAFLNHPQLSAHIDENDEDALSYMTSLEVDGFKSSRMGYRICFQFSRNPYFQNNFIVKEFHVGEGGSLTSLSNPILWHRGRNLAALGGMVKGPGRQRVYQSFFGWFTDHSSPSADEIAEILKDDLWKNPLQYYLTPMWELKENGRSADKGKGNGDECVVISDSDEDEGEEGLSREEDEEQSASEEGESVEESDGEGEVVIDGSEDSEAEGSGEEDSSGDEGDEEELEVEELDLDDSLEVGGQEAEGQQGEEEDVGVGNEDDS